MPRDANGMTTAEGNGTRDVLVARPDHLEQTDVLADRLGVRASFGWKQILRWAGWQLLARGVDPGAAAEMARVARECGLEPRVRASRAPGKLERLISRNGGRLGRTILLVGSVASFAYLYLYDHYNPVGHVLGFVWLRFVSRNWTVFSVVKIVAAVLASVGIGLFAMLLFFLVTARLGLTNPLLAPGASVPRTPAAAPAPNLPAAPAPGQRRLPLYVLGALCITALIAAAIRLSARFPLEFPRSRPLAAVTHALTPLPLDLDRARAASEMVTRPLPDRRVLLAVADVHRMLTGIDWHEAEAVYDHGEWIIRHLGTEVGRLPEFPSFADATALLRAWAVRLGAAPGRDSARVEDREPLLERDAFALLRAAQRRWTARGRDPEIVRDAAVALTSLSFALLDRMEIGDVIAARALATVACAEAGGGRLQRTPPLLAAAMGYAVEARALASALPADDATREYLERNDDALARAADAASSSTWVRYLWLRRLIALGRVRDEWSFRTTRLSELAGTLAIERELLDDVLDVEARNIFDALPRVHTALRGEVARERLDPATQMSAVARAWLRAREMLSSLWDATRSESLLAHFDRLAVRAGSTGSGPFYEPPIVRAYYTSALFSGILHVVRRFDSEGDATRLNAVGELLRSKATPESLDLDRWYTSVHGPQTVLDDDARPVDALATIESFGHEPLLLLVEKVPDATAGGKPDRLRAARLLAARFDTRPEHRIYAEWHAWNETLDLPESERICRSLSALGESDSNCARLLGDRDRLLAIVRDGTEAADYRARALKSSIAQLGWPTVDAEFRALLTESHGAWQVLDGYVDALEEQKEYGRGREVLLAWLGQHDRGSLPALLARVAAARMLYHQAKYAEAWAEIQPLLSTGLPAVQMRAAYILSALGRKDEAERFARERLERLKDWQSQQLLAEILWRDGNYAEATRMLLHPPLRIEDAHWSQAFGEPFAKAFAQRSDDDVRAAFSAARTAGVAPRLLRKLITHMESRPALAFDLEASLGPVDPADIARAYKYLRSARGETAALEWARPRIRADASSQAARAIYGAGQFDLLWNALPDSQSDATWRLRAAAFRLEPGSNRREEQLLAHFKESADHVGRMLMGLEGAESLRPASFRELCQAAYFVGVREQGKHSLAEAASWYRLAIDTEQTDAPEFRWARAALLAWSAAGKGLIASEHPAATTSVAFPR